MEENTNNPEIEKFIADWPSEGQSMRDYFMMFYQELSAMTGVSFHFIARPGISYSLRPQRKGQKDRDFFAIVDVIDDDPSDRWLSVCFYRDMIDDPDNLGEVIPGGLAGNDGYCFDITVEDQDLVSYLVARLRTAYSAAG